MTALFSSALVLGLYLFTLPQTPSTGPAPGEYRYELMDDVDWTLVGDCGLIDNAPNPVMMFETPQNSPTTDFINFGGPVSMGGSAPTGGYVSARRVLLDYAHLMDEMGAWKPKTFSRILHIMSDVLEEPSC